MFQIKTNKEIGAYLSDLIKTRGFDSTRQFGKECLKLSGVEATDEELRKMSNRLSQIKQGKKAIQTYDLPIFTHLLNVSSEEILSAGTYSLPYEDRMTNYKFAASKDQKTWEEYIERKDGVLHYTDEYGKTFLDYALEFHNYDLLKFLMNKGYIWFVGNDSKEFNHTFRAGTSFEKAPLYEKNYLEAKIEYSSEIRTRMIQLAVEREDFEMLQNLHAREEPSMYLSGYSNCWSIPDYDKFNKELIQSIAKANESVIKYFTEEFEVITVVDKPGHYMYPYINELTEYLIKTKSNQLKEVLTRCLEHNQKVLERLKDFIKQIEGDLIQNVHYEKDKAKETAYQTIKDYAVYEEKHHIVKFSGHFFVREFLVTNVVRIDAKMPSVELTNLANNINQQYQQILMYTREVEYNG